MKLTNNLNLPQPIVDAVMHRSYDGPFGENTYSVTQLLSPPRQSELIRRHQDEITEDVSDRIWALLGTSIHEILEKSDKSEMKEERLWSSAPEIPGIKITGRYDRMALVEQNGRHILQDYKIGSVWEAINDTRPEREQQLNVLRWLAVENGYEIDGIENIFIFRDWSKRKAAFEDNYPSQQIKVIPQPMWDIEEARKFVYTRTLMHLATRAADDQDSMPHCTAEEIWEKPTTYAVMGRGQKRAKRVFTDHNAAFDWAEANLKPGNWEIETRPGEATRCESYCAVAHICNQFRGDKK